MSDSETSPQSGTYQRHDGGKGVLTKCHGALDKRSKTHFERFLPPTEPGAVELKEAAVSRRHFLLHPANWNGDNSTSLLSPPSFTEFQPLQMGLFLPACESWLES